MASTGAPTENDGEWMEHVRTYNAFILILKISGISTAALLLLLYFFLVR